MGPYRGRRGCDRCSKDRTPEFNRRRREVGSARLHSSPTGRHCLHRQPRRIDQSQCRRGWTGSPNNLGDSDRLYGLLPLPHSLPLQPTPTPTPMPAIVAAGLSHLPDPHQYSTLEPALAQSLGREITTRTQSLILDRYRSLLGSQIPTPLHELWGRTQTIRMPIMTELEDQREMSPLGIRPPQKLDRPLIGRLPTRQPCPKFTINRTCRCAFS